MRNVRNTQQPLIVALCGDSGSGKTTLTDGMVQVFGQERIVHICLDDYHTLDRATRLRTGITALHPDANDLALMTDQLGRLARGESVVKPIYDHKTGTFAAPEEIHPADIIIVHGLHPLYTEKLRSLAYVRIYLDPEAALLQQWKIMREQDMPPKEIARQLGMGERTVRDWLKRGTFPEAKKRRKRQSSFDPFAPYILKRWQNGERNGLALWREIKAQGYTGTERSVYRYLETLKQAEVRASVNPARIQKYSAKTAVWLFMRNPKTLDEIEREDLVTFCQASTTLKRAYSLIQDFLNMVHKREGERLDAWLTTITESDLPELLSFASGVEKDKAAVRAGLTWPINNGMVEGHVTKLKLIKRQMYGKAGFALLRQRVLHAL